MELFKYGGDILKETLLSLFNDIWKRHQIPEDWKTELVINVYKKDQQMTAKITEVLPYYQQCQKYSLIKSNTN
jgi:hypothetical protein